MSKKSSRERGFTLVEIMIVVLIIGILMAIAVPQFVNARTQSQTQTCLDNMKQIETAKEEWCFQTKQTSTATPATTDLAPTYIKTFPTCPAAGTYTIGSMSVRPTCTATGHVMH